MSRPQWWRRKQFEAEGIRDADDAGELIRKMYDNARRLFPMETPTWVRRKIAGKLGICLRTVANWTR
jgi:hypothetical protein